MCSFLRRCWAVLCAALLHPRSTTVIDTDGNVVARYPPAGTCPQCDERELRSLGSSPGGVYCPNCGWDISVEQLS
jgi:hypothetical protein